jgi:lipoate-protein ligase B
MDDVKPSDRPVQVFRLGTLEYAQACRVQEAAAGARGAGEIGDVLLLVEHPPVITVGRGGGEEDILAPASVLLREGITVAPTDRGGRATYHGPGQLVAYPICVPPDGNLYRYVWRLEEVVIRVMGVHGLPAGRIEKHPGVWIDGEKVAAIGLAVRNGVTRHGLALNVAPKMAHFDLLIPCGITDHGVTSMERLLGRTIDVTEVADHFVQAFGDVFERRMVQAPEGARERVSESAKERVGECASQRESESASQRVSERASVRIYE